MESLWSLCPFRKLTNACIGKQAQMKKLPRISRISRSGENLAQPYPPHRRPSANILAPVAQANAFECQFLQEATRRACLRDGRQGVAARSAAPVWGVGLRGLWVCAGFIRALIREIRAIRGCFIFCGFKNATAFLISMNGDDSCRKSSVSLYSLWFAFQGSIAAAGRGIEG
jgi:hypothetical protein